MNQKLWLDGLDGIIPGGVSTTDFSKVINADKNTARKILEELARNHIGRFDGEVMEFDDGDKIKAVMFALEKGIPVDEAAEHLDWKDFEGLTAQILDIKDFAIIRNLILTNPRMEIDVIGIKFGVAMLIDCKHWKRHSQSALEKAVLKQVERTKQYVAKTKGAIAAPAIVTLYQDKVELYQQRSNSSNIPICIICRRVLWQLGRH
ncbi:hypothetical protein [Candidatus Nitrosotenuis chungbukensis]|uniref:hypothetical protein n=1 Tax=Candidatus Nitrosotenuis chungbukensis TaxID=1353246 RepID=UPI002A4E171C|nr:hypothetical protein [Candidatus Nitrosotenuis chungbukensis]